MNSVGTTCAKGQAGLQAYYDPYRINKPLKRSGPRGSGQWETIDWTTAIDEICNGGTLPGAKAGEAAYDFEGLADIRQYVTKDEVITAYETARAAAAVGTEITALTDFTAMAKADRDLIVAQLDAGVAAKLIDPDNPNFGPKANQLVHTVGRAEHGRKEFTDRFFGDYYGTYNLRNDHTDICELPRHDATVLIRKKTKAPADYPNSEFVIFFGSSRLEAGFPFQAAARKVIRGINDGNLKIAVVDPRFSVTASKGDWYPIIPGTDGALAMGMLRHMIENSLYDVEYCKNATYAAASADSEATWCDATYLVRDDDGKFLKPADAGLSVPADATGKYVIWDGTAAKAVYLPDGEKYKMAIEDGTEHGTIEYTGTVNAIPVKSSFTLLKAAAQQKTIAEYATACGLTEAQITGLAVEFTSHGKKAVVEYYRGVAQHTNGLHSAFALGTLNTIIGNSDHRGGVMYGGHNWYEFGQGKSGSFHDLKSSDTKPGKVSSWGLKVSRGGAKYEDTTEFTDDGYPASHVYFPLLASTGHAKAISHACMEGVLDSYPYPTKAYFATKANYPYSMPAMRGVIEEGFRDKSVVPLFVTFDIVVGEFSSLADYILPDGTFFEQWGTPHYYYSILTKGSSVRQPVMPYISSDIKTVENVCIELGKKLGFTGYGTGGLGTAGDLNDEVDWYHACVANVGGQAKASGVAGVKDLTTEAEMVDYLLARGGVFEDASKSYDSDGNPAHKWKYKTSPFHVYSEPLGTTKSYLDGSTFPGTGTWVPPQDSAGNSIDDAGYDFHVITYKLAQHTQSRTAANPWLMKVIGDNHIEINKADADSMGISTGDMIRMVSKTNPGGVIGKARVIEGIRPKVVAVSHSLGHWQYGTRANVVDGAITGHDSSRGSGISANSVMRMDNNGIGNGKSGLRDVLSGGLCFFDTKVKIERL